MIVKSTPLPNSNLTQSQTTGHEISLGHGFNWSRLRRCANAPAVVLAAFLAILFSVPRAEATITITNVINASAFTGISTITNQTTTTGTPTPTTSQPIIYGGMAGDDSRCNKDGVHLCSTCTGAATSGATSADNRLLACNDNRIYPALNLQIVFTSTSAGYPAIYPAATATVTSPGPLAIPGQSTATIPAGSAVTLSVPWSLICPQLVPQGTTTNTGTSTNTGSDCTNPNGEPYALATFNIGIVAAATTPTASPATTTTGLSDQMSITIEMVQDVGQAATTAAAYANAIAGESLGFDCGDAQDQGLTAIGLCHFATQAGDSKIAIQDAQALNSFPNSGTVPFTQVKVLYSPVSFADIGAESPSAYLGITTNSDGSFSLSPNRVLGLQNNTQYYFKVASVDAAGNVGYYTPEAFDTANTTASVCQGDQDPLNCHSAMPGLVLGVLAKNLNCFIATAAYGSPMAPQVQLFREFRNRFLLPSKLGTRFVQLYYKYSPKYAQIIANHEGLRTAARFFLWPVLAYAYLSLHLGFFPALFLIAALFGFVISSTKQFRKRRRLGA